MRLHPSRASTKLNVDNPNDFYKYIGEDGGQWGIDLVTDLDGNIYILGKTESLLDGKQIYVVKTDPRGNVLWKNTLGDRGDEEPKDIEMIAGGDLVLVSDWTNPSGQKRFCDLQGEQDRWRLDRHAGL